MSEESSKPTNRSLFDWLGFRRDMDWNVAKPLGRAFGSILAIAIPLLFFGSIIAAAFVLWGTIRDIGSGASSGPNLGAGAMIAALLGAPFIIWGTYLRQRAVEFQKEGLLTDRINKAVEMLGADKTWLQYTMDEAGNPVQVERTVPNIEVRIGGLLSLERIAQDSVRYDEGRDHVRVMEILCAYVRENAPASEARNFPLIDWEPLSDDATQEQRDSQEKWRLVRFGRPYECNAEQWALSLPKPRQDISIALRVIGRRNNGQKITETQWTEAIILDEENYKTKPFERPKKINKRITSRTEIIELQSKISQWKKSKITSFIFKIDLRNTNLQGADLSELDFESAIFLMSRLEGANLIGTNLKYCMLNFTHLDGARLQKADLQGADLFGARLEAARMEEANLQCSNLNNAYIDGADLRSTDLTGADLAGASLEWSLISKSKLQGANFRNARMEGATLYDSVLDFSNLEETRLRRSSLFKASMKHCYLHNTRIEYSDMKLTDTEGLSFKGLDLREVNISQQQLVQCFGDISVLLPAHLKRPKYWPGWNLPPFVDDGFKYQWQMWRTDPANYTPPPKPDNNPET